ncbi:hypothetical protein NQZ79_g4907 [Umbelopsis isabellina]|nr:hypothetical protein NQZ79_g4907 [Umbelopsis isabellina]
MVLGDFDAMYSWYTIHNRNHVYRQLFTVDTELDSLRPTFDIDDNQTDDSTHVPPLIDNSVLIAIASVLGASVLLCIVIAFWCYRRPVSENHSKREENASKEAEILEKDISRIPTQFSSTESPYQSQINPSQFTQFSNIYSDDSYVQPSELSTDIHAFTEPLPRALDQNVHGKLKPLTSTDAVLLGDMFRHKMRRPDWATDSQVTEVEPAEQPAFGSKLIKQLQNADRLKTVSE